MEETDMKALFCTLAFCFVANPAVADYLNLSVGAVANPNTNRGLSWDGVSGATYKVGWKKSSATTWAELEVDQADVTFGSDSRWYFVVGNLSCNTPYDFRVKRKGRGWRQAPSTTSACPGAECLIATGNLVLNSSADHVFFIGSDKRVYNHWINSGKWQLDALGPAQIAAGGLVLNSTGSNLFFVGTDKRVYNYWINSGKWQLDALGSAQVATAPLVLSASGSQVFFIGTDKRVYNYWINSGNWQLDWLGPAQVAAGGLALNSSADHVFFIGTDKRVYNYWINAGKWQLDALCW